MQQPDSTVISENSFKETTSSSCGTSSVLSSNSSLPVDLKKPPQPRRSSVISLDYDSDDTDLKPFERKNSRTICVESESVCESPSAHSSKKPPFNLSDKTSTDLNDSDLFFSAKKPEAVMQNKSKTPTYATAEDAEADDFYIDDFDIDDFNDSDIPDYFEPPASSVSSQNFSTVTTTVKEGGPSKSSWEKKPTTPVSAPKTSKICSPGKSTWLKSI